MPPCPITAEKKKDWGEINNKKDKMSTTAQEEMLDKRVKVMSVVWQYSRYLKQAKKKNQ